MKCCDRGLALVWLRDTSSIYMIHGGSSDMSSEMRHGTAYPHNMNTSGFLDDALSLSEDSAHVNS